MTYGLEVRCSIQLSYGCFVWQGWRDSNPHLIDFKSIASADWATSPWSQHTDFNRKPVAYKATALPIELCWLAPRLGLEPRTLRLTAECSTIELPRNQTVRFIGLLIILVSLFLYHKKVRINSLLHAVLFVVLDMLQCKFFIDEHTELNTLRFTLVDRHYLLQVVQVFGLHLPDQEAL